MFNCEKSTSRNGKSNSVENIVSNNSKAFKFFLKIK